MQGRGRAWFPSARGSLRLIGATALVGTAVLAPPAFGASHTTDPACPRAALCVFPQANYQGEAWVLDVPHSRRVKATWLDDGHCLHLPVGSVIDNSIYGATFYANDECDDSGESQDVIGRGKVAKFSSWKVRSFVFPLDYNPAAETPPA